MLNSASLAKSVVGLAGILEGGENRLPFKSPPIILTGRDLKH